jgi:hypothetical protein
VAAAWLSLSRVPGSLTEGDRDFTDAPSLAWQRQLHIWAIPAEGVFPMAGIFDPSVLTTSGASSSMRSVPLPHLRPLLLNDNNCREDELKMMLVMTNDLNTWCSRNILAMIDFSAISGLVALAPGKILAYGPLG